MKTSYFGKGWPWLGWLVSILVGLSLVLAACGGENVTLPVQTGAAGAATTAAQTSAAVETSVPAAPATATAETTTSNTPVGLPTRGLDEATTPVAVSDGNVKGELVIWEALNGAQATLAKEQATAFGKAYPGIKVSFVHFESDELIYSVEDAMKGGKLPDLMLASADFVTDLNSFKALQPADKVLDKSFLEGLAAKALGGSTVSGTQWGVPYIYGGTPLMLYNKKLVPNAPTTWEELSKVTQPLYDQSSRKIGLAVDLTEPYLLVSLLGAFEGAVLDGKNQPTLNTPQMVSSLTFVQDLIKNRTVRDASRQKLNQIEYAFRDGRLGVYIGGDWLIEEYAGAINPTATDAKLDLGLAPLPKVDKTGKSPAPFSNSKTFFIGAQTKGNSLQAAKLYLEWTAKPEQQTAILEKARVLPATKAFLASEKVTSSPIWSGLLSQLELGQPQPPALEMRAVWDALRPNLQDVASQAARPAEAARKMQQTALENVTKLAVK